MSFPRLGACARLPLTACAAEECLDHKHEVRSNAFTPPPTDRTTMPDLRETLERLGLQQYYSALADNGFDTWETVLDITEDDLQQLDFKLGHRRALQREIATFRGFPLSYSLEPEGTGSSQSSLSVSALENLSGLAAQPRGKEGKRRYRRHPRPDNNAPKKPKTAYVNFADHLRTDPSISCLSFVDIAKEVGRRWQNLSPESKRVWESQAARATQEYEAEMDEYKKTVPYRKYQAYLEDFRTQQAQAKNGKRGAGVQNGTSGRRANSGGSPSSSGSPVSIPSSNVTEAEICHNALTLAMSEIVSLRGEVLSTGVKPYDSRNLPPQELTRRAMYAFIKGTGSLVFMWTQSQADEILDRIYNSEAEPDPMTLAECFIVAAMGAHYDIDSFPDRVRQALYASGTLHFDEKIAKFDYLRTMRLLLSMSFYSLLEKHMSARYLVAAGLQIARWKCPQLHQYPHDVDSDNWRRIFRTLIFMDCWLSYTLGYASEITQDDISFACAPYNGSTTMNDAIHVQTSKVGLVAAEIAKTLSNPHMVTRENVGMLAEKLEIWRSEVPAMLQISTLTSSHCPDLTLYQRRAILMVHIMYLGALILLYRQSLVAAAEAQLASNGDKWTLDMSVQEIKKYRVECAIAAQQMARILGLISFDGTLTKRCWLIIYWSFTACIVLLFGATSKLIDGMHDGVEEDLTYAKGCLDILQPCCDYEPIATKYMNILRPLYDTLRTIHSRTLGKAKTSIFSLLQPSDPAQLSPPMPVSKAEVGPIAGQLSNLLTDPFGRNQKISGESMRRVLSPDGSYTVFWWR